jgi:hypothetical protein
MRGENRGLMGNLDVILTLAVGGVVVALATLSVLASALTAGDLPATGREGRTECRIPLGHGAVCGKRGVHLDPFRGERICEEHFRDLLGRVGLERLMDADMRYASSRSGARSARSRSTE